MRAYAFPALRHAGGPRPARVRGGRRQRGDGRRPHRPPPGRRRASRSSIAARWKKCPPGPKRSITREQEGILFRTLCARSSISATHGAWSARSAARRWSWASRTPRAGGGPCPRPATCFTLDTDLVIIAIGSGANPLLTRQTTRPGPQPPRLHRGQRHGRDQSPRRLGRRRHRHRQRHRDPGHGRRQDSRQTDARVSDRPLGAGGRWPVAETGIPLEVRDTDLAEAVLTLSNVADAAGAALV